MNLPSLRPSSHIWKSKASMYITEKPSSKAHTDNTRINTTRKSGKKEEQTKINESRLTDAFEKTHATKCEAFFSSFQKWAEKHDKPPYNETEIPQILQIYRLRGQVLKKEAFFNSCALFFLRVGLDEFLMLEATVVRWLHLNLCQTTLYKRSLENFITLSMSSFAATFSPIWPAIQKSFRHRNFHNEGKWGWAFKKKEIAGNNDSPQRAPALCP